MEGILVKEIRVRLRSFQDVRELCTLAGSMPCEVQITDGKRTVNAKSIMCIFGLSIRRHLTLRLDCGEEDFEAFRQKAARFEVQ